MTGAIDVSAPGRAADPEAGLKAFSAVAAFLVNAGMVVALVFAHLASQNAPEEPAFEYMEAELVTMKGIEAPKNALPRIVAPPPPPEPAAAPVNLSQTREEEPDPVAIEKKAAEEEKKKQDEARVRQEQEKKQQEDEKKRRQEAMARAMRDVRADEDAPQGHASGSEFGNTTDLVQARELGLWQAEVAARIRPHLQRPISLTPDQCNRLEAQLFFKLDATGRVVGQPTVYKRSGDRFFDDAAVRAVRQFGPDGEYRLPMPEAPSLRQVKRDIQTKGINFRVPCKAN